MDEVRVHFHMLPTLSMPHGNPHSIPHCVPHLSPEMNTTISVV